MTPATFAETDKYLSAVQAALILVALVTPLAFSVNFRKVVIAQQPITVAIVSAPELSEPVQSEAEVKAVRQQLEATRKNLEQAEVARRRQKQKADEQKKIDEELRLAEVKKKEAEKKFQEEELRLAEVKKKEAEKKLQEIEERQVQQRKKDEVDKKKRAAAAKQRQAKIDAKLVSDRNLREMNRHIGLIHDRVKRHLTSPDKIDTSIQVEISVPLKNDGKLAGSPKVIRSSGNDAFDDLAVRAIIRAAQDGFELPSDPDLRAQFDELILIVSPRQ